VNSSSSNPSSNLTYGAGSENDGSAGRGIQCGMGIGIHKLVVKLNLNRRLTKSQQAGRSRKSCVFGGNNLRSIVHTVIFVTNDPGKGLAIAVPWKGHNPVLIAFHGKFPVLYQDSHI